MALPMRTWPFDHQRPLSFSMVSANLATTSQQEAALAVDTAHTLLSSDIGQTLQHALVTININWPDKFNYLGEGMRQIYHFVGRSKATVGHHLQINTPELVNQLTLVTLRSVGQLFIGNVYQRWLLATQLSTRVENKRLACVLSARQLVLNTENFTATYHHLQLRKWLQEGAFRLLR